MTFKLKFSETNLAFDDENCVSCRGFLLRSSTASSIKRSVLTYTKAHSTAQHGSFSDLLSHSKPQMMHRSDAREPQVVCVCRGLKQKVICLFSQWQELEHLCQWEVNFTQPEVDTSLCLVLTAQKAVTNVHLLASLWPHG